MHTYNNILETANRLFAKQGYTATSIRQIAQESGIGKATVYHHFPNKQSIITALLNKDSFNIQEIINIVECENNPKRKIELIVQNTQKTLIKSIDIILIVRREIPEYRNQIQSEYIPFFKKYCTLLSDAIQLGVDQGIFRPTNTMEAARVLMILIQGMFAGVLLSGGLKQPLEDLTSAILDIYFHGIENK